MLRCLRLGPSKIVLRAVGSMGIVTLKSRLSTGRYAYRPVMQLGEMLHDRQPQADAAFLVARLARGMSQHVVAAVERLEQSRYSLSEMPGPGPARRSSPGRPVAASTTP